MLRRAFVGSRKSRMVFIQGTAGKIEAKFQPSKELGSPVAILLHPHPQFQGCMDHQIIYQAYYAFAHRGFSVLRLNFRGVGASDGVFDDGKGEVEDASSALDWVHSLELGTSEAWVFGFSFGAWVGLQLLQRRPEIAGHVSISPLCNLQDFTQWMRCPPGIVLHGSRDAVVPADEINRMVSGLRKRSPRTELVTIPGANHFFDGKVTELMRAAMTYVDSRVSLM